MFIRLFFVLFPAVVVSLILYFIHPYMSIFSFVAIFYVGWCATESREDGVVLVRVCKEGQEIYKE